MEDRNVEIICPSKVGGHGAVGKIMGDEEPEMEAASQERKALI